MRALLTGLFCVLLASPASATKDEMSCRLIPILSSGAAFTTVDISGGAITSDAFPAANTRTSYDAPRFSYLKVSVDIVDADNGISNVRLTFTESETRGGKYRVTPLCINAAPVLTCGFVAIDWDPQTYGKSWTIKPIDWGFLYGKITLTPTGHGASDTATLTVYGCTE
jgi:hypothetical protein